MDVNKVIDDTESTMLSKSLRVSIRPHLRIQEGVRLI